MVFLRGVNVGGHRAFKPAALAKDLAALDVVNVGAAGTFVVRGAISHTDLRSAILHRLPFQPDIMICTAREVMDLVSADPFPRDAQGGRRFVTVLEKRVSAKHRFPIMHPSTSEWQVKVVGTRGKFVLSLWRPMGKRLVYPNEVVEKQLGVPSTTRNWDTIGKIIAVLERGEKGR